MKIIKNEKGIALVMVLVISLMALAMVSALLYMLTQGTTMSGSQKFYHYAEEASYGGTEVATQYLGTMGQINLTTLGAGLNFTASCNCNDPYVFTDNIDLMTGLRTDRCDKLCNPTAQWPAAYDEGAAAGIQVSLNATTNSDLTFTLGVAPQTFDVFVKVVDTVQGNSDVSSLVTGGALGGAGVVASTTGIVSPPHNPFLYRLEVQSQATNNPREQAKMSVLYAF